MSADFMGFSFTFSALARFCGDSFSDLCREKACKFFPPRGDENRWKTELFFVGNLRQKISLSTRRQFENFKILFAQNNPHVNSSCEFFVRA
jgi:hypothetical protein